MELRKPGKSRLLVSIIENEPVLPEGRTIYIEPDYLPTKQGTILAVGECSSVFNVGDRCTIMSSSGINIGGDEYIIHETEILYTESV